MKESKRAGKAKDSTRAVKSRDRTRGSKQQSSAESELVLAVACALDLEQGRWLVPLSGVELGEERAKAIVASILKGIGLAERVRRADLPTGVLEVRFDYRGGAARLTRSLLPKLQSALAEFLKSPSPTADRRHIEGTLIRMRLLMDVDQVAQAVRDLEASRPAPWGRSTSKSAGGTESTGELDADQAVNQLIALIHQARSLSSPANPEDPVPTLLELQAICHEVRHLIGQELAAVFNIFAGQRYDLKTSKAAASLIDQTAKSFGLFFRFTAADGIEREARLRCQPTGRDLQPTFQFQSTSDEGERTIHAATRTLPRLTMRPKSSSQSDAVSR